MSGKILEMPKSNAQLWSDLFASFCRDIDKVAAHQKEQQVSCGHGAQRDAATALRSGEETPAGIQSYRQSQEVMNLDDLGIGFGKREEIL